MPEPVEIQKPVTPAPEPAKPAEPTEDQYRAYVRDKYGIQDDPDAFKVRQRTYEEAASNLPKYAQAVEELQRHIQSQQPRQQPTGNTELERIRDLANRDPLAAAQSLHEYQMQGFKQLLDQHAQQTQVRTRYEVWAGQEQDRAAKDLRSDWPEAYDEKSDLHKLGKNIYTQEMSDMERAHPRGFYIATERAAGRLGLAPKARRTTNAPTYQEVESQNVGRGARRPANVEEPDVRLTEADKRKIEAMELDRETFLQAKKARKEGRDLKKTD